VSLVGDALFMIAINWLILERTGSALLIGGNVIFALVSGVIFGSVAGVLADRWDRRWIMAGSEMVSGFAVLVLWLSLTTGVFNIWLVYTITFMLTAVSAFSTTAYQSLIPNLLHKEDLVTGRSLIVSSSRLFQATSAALSGLLIAAWGTQTAILINAVSFFFSAAMVAMINIPGAAKHDRGALTPFAFLRDTAAGWRYIRSVPVLISLFVLFTFADFGAGFTWPVHALFAEKALGGGSELYGYLSTASLLGSFFGAYFIGRYSSWFNLRPGRSFALAAFLWGCLSIVFSQTTSAPMALGLRFFTGWALSMIHVPISSLLDVSMGDGFRGRVWATIGIGSQTAGATAVFLSGVLADQTSPRASYLVAGLLLVVAAMLASIIPAIRSAKIAT
jgi:MFS family permease